MKFIFAKNTLMDSIPRYNFCKNKYGEELLIDIVSLKSISKYICTTPVHTLSYYDITVITNGNGSITIDGSRYELKHGDIIFSRPKEVRQWDTNNYPEGYAIIFEEDFLLSFFNDTSFINELSFFNINSVSAIINIAHIYEKISNLINSLINEINNNENKDKHILRALLYEFLTVLNREYINMYNTDNTNHNNRYVDEFLKLADRNFKSIHDTKYYANKLCITPNYLNEILHRNIGIGPKQIIQDKIIKETKRLLLYTPMSIEEISYYFNYDNPSYFIRLFKKKTNITPLKYREQHIR